MKYFGIMLSVFGLDTVTKIWARKKLPLGGKTEIIKNRVYFRRIKNDGMAYNTLERNPKAVLYLTGGLIGWCFAAFFMMLTKQEEKKHLLLPLSVMLGGALGNFWDRIRRGGVIDEYLIYVAPVFLGDGRRLLDLPSFKDLCEGVALEFTDIQKVGPDVRLMLRPVR